MKMNTLLLLLLTRDKERWRDESFALHEEDSLNGIGRIRIMARIDAYFFDSHSLEHAPDPIELSAILDSYA